MVVNIIIQTLIVLSVSIMVGELFEQFKFPAVVGYLLSGLLIGPFTFNFIQSSVELQSLSSLSLFFIIFLLGIEMKTEFVIKYFKPAVKMTITSFILPLAVAFTLSALLFDFPLKSDFIIALAVAVPSISIISVLVMRFKLTRDPRGITVVGSVIITDVIAFLLLGLTYKTVLDAILVVIYFVIFLIIFLNIDKLLNKGSKSLLEHISRANKLFKSEHFSYAIIIISGLLVGVISELIGVNYIMGVFFAGLIIHEGLIGRTLFHKIRRTLKRMNDGFFIPLFFGIAGIEVSGFSVIKAYIPEIIFISVALISFSLLINYFFSKRIMSVKNRKWRIKISAIINGRGAVGIAIATIALRVGVITPVAYSIVILATILISLIATALLRNG